VTNETHKGSESGHPFQIHVAPDPPCIYPGSCCAVVLHGGDIHNYGTPETTILDVAMAFGPDLTDQLEP